jgi:DNA anti-recombination protein RmuC
VNEFIGTVFPLEKLDWFGLTILAITGALTVVGLAHPGRAVRAHLPTLITSLGIFGTFYGVLQGLVEFKPDDIKNSVPALIAGVSTAFSTSFWAILGAILIKGRYSWQLYRGSSDGKQKVGATIEDLAAHLQSIDRSLTGDGDNSVNSHLAKLRLANKEGFDGVRESLAKALEQLSKASTEQIVEALREVVRNFNTIINEQFGENFAQLNLAMEKILVWQEQYRNQMTEMIQQQTVTAENMGTMSERYKALVAAAESYSQVVESMQASIEKQHELVGQLAISVDLLDKVINGASASVPKLKVELESAIVSAARGIDSSTKQMSGSIETSMARIKEAIEQQDTEMRRVIASTERALETQTTALSKKIESSMTGMTEGVQRGSEAYRKQMQEQTDENLRNLGKSLAAISEKFANDYTNITDRLMEIAKQLERGARNG